MQPLVFDREPLHKDGELLYKAASQPVAYFLSVKKFDRAKQYLHNLPLIASRMIKSDSSEPDYLRWRADSLLQTALEAQGMNAPALVANGLQGNIDTLREVHQKVGSDATCQDLINALEQGVKLTEGSNFGPLPVADWRNELQALQQQRKP
jgi:hypothetical protein